MIGLVAAIPGSFFFLIVPALVVRYMVNERGPVNAPYAISALISRAKRRWASCKYVLLVLLGLVVMASGCWAAFVFVSKDSDSFHHGTLNPFSCARSGKEGYLVFAPGNLDDPSDTIDPRT